MISTPLNPDATPRKMMPATAAAQATPPLWAAPPANKPGMSRQMKGPKRRGMGGPSSGLGGPGGGSLAGFGGPRKRGRGAKPKTLPSFSNAGGGIEDDGLEA